MGDAVFDIPETCIGGVVVNEGPNFHVEVQQVKVPSIGKSKPVSSHSISCRAQGVSFFNSY